MNICKRKDLLVVEIPLEILRDSTVEVNSTTAVVSRTKSIFVFNNNLKVNVVYNRKLTCSGLCFMRLFGGCDMYTRIPQLWPKPNWSGGAK